MKSEAEVQAEIQKAGPPECILMRNNNGAYKDQTGRFVYYGLGNVSKKHSENIKSSDLIGITTVKITPDMVGQEIGIFTAIEVKAEGRRSFGSREKAQMNFIEWVRSRGGIAGMVNSVDQFKAALRR